MWGTKADLAFFSIDHNPNYFDYGLDEPAHIAFFALGDAYTKPEKDLNSLPRDVMLKNMYHRRYIVRTQAALALRKVGALDALEKFLSDPRTPDIEVSENVRFFLKRPLIRVLRRSRGGGKSRGRWCWFC